MPTSADDDAESSESGELHEVLRAVAAMPPAQAEVAARAVFPAELAAIPAELAVDDSVPPEPKLGDLLEQRYLIERTLGRGGMGVVFAAKNVRTGKSVAIKWMLRGRTSTQLDAKLERFRREARAVGMIQHPNVIDVFDVGGSEQAPFLVMELLEGESLRERLRRGPLSLEQAVRLFSAVIRGVSAAHCAGVIHRDLKPDNIFLCVEHGAAEPVPKVVDFGVAAVLGGSLADLESLTCSGTMIGTPSYMPLEQLKGDELDARADVYALGVVLYEALSGKLPFVAKTASELAVMQAMGEPTPISRHRAELAGPCEELLKRVLARNPAARPASADELGAALEQLVAPRETRPLHSRKRVWAVAVLATSVAVALASLYGRSSAPAAVARIAPVPMRIDASSATPKPAASLGTPARIHGSDEPFNLGDAPSATPAKKAGAAPPKSSRVIRAARAADNKTTSAPAVRAPEEAPSTELLYDEF